MYEIRLQGDTFDAKREGMQDDVLRAQVSLAIRRRPGAADDLKKVAAESGAVRITVSRRDGIKGLPTHIGSKLDPTGTIRLEDDLLALC